MNNWFQKICFCVLVLLAFQSCNVMFDEKLAPDSGAVVNVTAHGIATDGSIPITVYFRNGDHRHYDLCDLQNSVCTLKPTAEIRSDLRFKDIDDIQIVGSGEKIRVTRKYVTPYVVDLEMQ